jgi:phosphoenolpyruvate synthase/pyruvate phosphate dikinase
MVPAEVSGIMFTANPINGARDEIVLDAAWGLGEAIVGGLVTPDHVVVDKVTGAIKQITIADKSVMTQPTATGTEERPVEQSKRHAQVLEVGQATELAKLGAEIEKYYGEPQDIEWCLGTANSTLCRRVQSLLCLLSRCAGEAQSPARNGSKTCRLVNGRQNRSLPLVQRQHLMR